MAKPIRNTPILTGSDARWFNQQVNNLPSAEERAKARQEVDESAERLEAFLLSVNAIKG